MLGGPHLANRFFVIRGDDHAGDHRERFAFPKLKAGLLARTTTHTAHRDIENDMDSDIRLLCTDLIRVYALTTASA